MREPCVIARLAGGLGNQLFMYAFNKSIAERNKVPLLLDVEGGYRQEHRHYKRRHLLHRLLPPEPAPGLWLARNFPLGKRLRKLDRIINRHRPLHERYYIEEPDLSYHPEIRNLRITRPTVFNGYWQAPQYFDDLQPSMNERIRFDVGLVSQLEEDQARIEAAGDKAVCLLIRRYEEVRNPRHHILDASYFTRAMAEIERQISNPHYFVFAQAMEWAREHIRSKNPVTFATPRDSHDGVIQDLYLMTRCHHYILSNSSLHWWAAFLNPRTDKIVLCPNQGWPNKDMLLKDWTRIE